MFECINADNMISLHCHHHSKMLFDTLHIPRVCFEGAMVIAHVSLWWLSGSVWAPVYLQLSGAFSLGAFCHPYLGFWLIQHASGPRAVVARKGVDFNNNNNNSAISTTPSDSVDGIRSDSNQVGRQDQDHEEKQRYSLLEFIRDHHLHPQQPTVSYGGSRVWHALNFSELLHVEHHDFPRVPCFRASALVRIAPQFYQDLAACPSILGAIHEWLMPPSNDWWMAHHGDFAGRYKVILLPQLCDVFSCCCECMYVCMNVFMYACLI
jgi:hypothetical protein